MINTSPKLLQKIIKTSLKASLFTISTAALISASGSLGVSLRTTKATNINFNTGNGLDGGVKLVVPSLLRFTGNHDVIAANVSVQAIDMNGYNADAKVTKSISIGSIMAGNGGRLTTTIIDNKILTLTGTAWDTNLDANIYDGLGNILLVGVNSALNIQSADAGIITLAGNINSAGDDEGILIVNTKADFNGAIGNEHSLSSVTFNNGDAVSTVGNIFATTVKIGQDENNVASIVRAGAINGAVHFVNAGELTVNGGIIRNVTTAGNGNDGGILFVGGGNIEGNVGANGNALNQVIFNTNGASTTGDIFADIVGIGHDNANVTTGKITGSVLFAQNGKLTLTDGITGNVETYDITRNGNNVNDIGNLVITGGNIANVGAANNALHRVTFRTNAPSNAGDIFATTVTINNDAADVTARDITGDIVFESLGRLDAEVITGNVNFIADGELFANNIDGSVTAASDDVNNNGALTMFGDVTGTIGEEGSPLRMLDVRVDNGNTVTLGDDVYAQTVTFNDVAGDGAVGTIQVNGLFRAEIINFGNNPQGGTLELNNIGSHLVKIENGDKAIVNINNIIQAFDPSIGTVATINIANGGALQINAKGANITILDEQEINFRDADSSLTLYVLNDRENATIQLGGNLVAAANGGGKLTFMGSKNNPLTIASDDANIIRNIGAADGDKFDTLNITNKVIVTDKINLSGINELNIKNGADFLDQSGTSAQIQEINIREATYTIDAQGGNIEILTNGNQINILHEDATLVLQNSSNADRTITLGADLNPDDDDEGIVVLNSVLADRTLKIAGQGFGLGGNNALNAIRFKGEGKFDVTDINLNTTNIELDVAEIGLGNTNANITLLTDTVLTQAGNITGSINFNGQLGAVILNNGVNVTGDIINTRDTNGTLIISGKSNIGGRINNIATLLVGAGDVTIGTGGDITINEIQGNGEETLTLPENFNLTGSINKNDGQALSLSFANNSSVSGVVGTEANPVGDITLAGNTRFASSVYSNGNVTLAQNSTANFARDVTANKLIADGATLNFDNNLEFNGNFEGSNTTLNLGANQIVYSGNATFTNVLTLNTIFDGATNTGGNIIISAGSNFDLSQVSDLNITVDANNVDINNLDPTIKYKLISAETAGGLTPVEKDKINLTVNNDNRFVQFTIDNSDLTLSAKEVTKEIIRKDFAKGGLAADVDNAPKIKQSLEQMADAEPYSDARKAINNFGLMTAPQAVDAVNHLKPNIVKPSEVAAIHRKVIYNNVSHGLNSVNIRMNNVAVSPVAAGDEDLNAQHGAWINPFIGNVTQKKSHNISGYKSNAAGGTVGFDGKIKDDLTLGLAYTRVEANVKLKDAKKGDKDKIHSNIFSLYGLYDLPKNFFVKAIASYGDSKVTTKSQRNIAIAKDTIGYQTAIGKYKSENYTGQLMVGYNYALPKGLQLTPLAGLTYSNIKDKGYKETGTTFQNLIVKGKRYNTFNGLAGAKLSTGINVKEAVVTPELYARIDYAFKNKMPAIDARLQGMTSPYPTDSFKPKKTSFDLGAGLTVKHKMMEYGINYDANIASKYFAQQGSLKVRVNL